MQKKEELRKTNNLFKEIALSLKPPPKLSLDSWADTYRILSSKSLSLADTRSTPR